jgi:hypothetical protein
MTQEKRVASLRTVRVPKEKLLGTLKTNRESHKKEFDDSLDGYWDAVALEIAQHMQDVQESMERNIERAKAQSEETRTTWSAWCVEVRKPIDHTDDYDRAIERLEWEIATEVDLEADEFDRYVLNKWPWLQDHLTSITSFASQHLGNYGGRR